MMQDINPIAIAETDLANDAPRHYRLLANYSSILAIFSALSPTLPLTSVLCSVVRSPHYFKGTTRGQRHRAASSIHGGGETLGFPSSSS